MMKRILEFIVFIGFLYLSSQQIAEWSGNVCFKTYIEINYTTVCNETTLFWCDKYINITEEYNVTDFFCCDGWTHNGDQNCSVPVCTSGCLNGGTCVNPNTCACAAGFEGPICQTESQCSHIHPCYPGVCSGSPEQCFCSNGFSGTTCLQFSTNFAPTLHSSDSTIDYVDPVTGSTVYTYSINSKSSDKVTWSNQNDFNRIQLAMNASFFANDTLGVIPDLPDYVNDVTFGVVQAGVTFKYTHDSGSSEFSVTCSDVSEAVPLESVPCTITLTLTFTVSSGDTFGLTSKATSGGVRKVQNPDTSIITRTELYSGHVAEDLVEFKFDFDVPTHCIQTGSCSSDPMEFLDDTTQFALKPYWSGWTDALSGILRYSFEVWKMEYDVAQDGLKEPSITSSSNPRPVFITDVMASNLSYPEFTPSEPGVYSCILEVNDRANNSEYVRRIVAFDPNPEITLDPNKRLYVSTATENTNYVWQTEYSLDGVTTIKVDWEGLFANTLHHQNNFLAQVLAYEPRLSDNIDRHNYKRILPEFNDNEGSRTVSAITNIRGIVKYEIAQESISKPKTSPPDFGWTEISPLVENASFNLASRTVGDGESHQVWIRASDIVSGNRTETTIIHFDQTGPQNHLTSVEYNINGEFRSRVNAISQDYHSGVENATYDIILSNTEGVKYHSSQTIVRQTTSECSKSPDCYCVPMGDCFVRTQSFEFDNCLLQVPLELIDSGTFVLNITSTNAAMLSTTSTLNLGTVSQFQGIDIYPSPDTVTFTNKTNTEVIIEWTNPETCYEIFQFVFYVHGSTNTSDMFTAGKDDRRMALSHLSPGVDYSIEMYTEYGNGSYIARSLVPLMKSFETAPYCSHLQPCYPGNCLSYTEQCVCSNGFHGSSCLTFDAQYKPTNLKCTATISYVDDISKTELYSYITDSDSQAMIWSNQQTYNDVSISFSADFDVIDILGVMPDFHNYVNNVSYGIVQGTVNFTHQRAGSVIDHRLLVCEEPMELNPIQQMSCTLNLSETIAVLSGDSVSLMFNTMSGGFIELKRINEGSITSVEQYTGYSSTAELVFNFDFDVSAHCSETTTCTDSLFELEEDITKQPIRPKWSGWTDDLSGISKYIFEVWKLTLNETTNLLEENPGLLFSQLTTNNSDQIIHYVPSEPGMYSCILQVFDVANNSEYVRRVVLYDPVSDVIVNQSESLFISSANPTTDYNWVTSYTITKSNLIQMHWRGLFGNLLHTTEHLLNEIALYDSSRVNYNANVYKQILPKFDDNEGKRTVTSIENIHGITKFQYSYEIVSIPSIEAPETGWTDVVPLADQVSVTMPPGSIGDGDSQQFWVRAFDALDNVKTETVLVHYDQSGPAVHLRNVEYNINNGAAEFISRISIETLDLHSGVDHVNTRIILNETLETKIERNFSIPVMSQLECSLSADCYCVSMGSCFSRYITFNIKHCDLKSHIDHIQNGTFLIEIKSKNVATLETTSTFKIGDVLQFEGINRYPSPQSVRVLNKTNSEVSIQWINTPTCFDISGFYIVLTNPDNTSDTYSEQNDTYRFTFKNLSPGVEYVMTLYTEYRYQHEIIRSPEPIVTYFSAEPFCSHLSPCYPGTCKSNVDECICSNGFSGETCLEFDVSYQPSLITAHAEIIQKDSSTGKVVYSYASYLTDAANIVWSNQKEFNRIEFTLKASFIGTNIYGTMPTLPNYLSNASFGIVEGWINMTHTSISDDISNRVLFCPNVSQDSPVSEFNCWMFIDDPITYESGDILIANLSVRSGGRRTLINFADGSEFAVEYYYGHVTHHVIQFKFDLDVPIHCSQSSSCTENPLVIEDDVTKLPIRPKWSGWTDHLSGISNYTIEVWKLTLNETSDLLEENQVPLFSQTTSSISSQNITFTPTEPGMYSCILEIKDVAENSELIRRVVLYDNVSDISINQSERLLILSANQNTEYSWVTIFNLTKSNSMRIQWNGLFSNLLHTTEHFLNGVAPYERSLDNETSYRRVILTFDDNEGKRTTASVGNLNGITRFQYTYELVSIPSTVAPDTGWIDVVPLADHVSVTLPSGLVGDGDTHQYWVRAFDILNNVKTETVLVQYDQSGPNVHLRNVEYNIDDGKTEFTTRISLDTMDLHSGVEHVYARLLLNRTEETKIERNFTIESVTQSECSLLPDCYCVPMGKCYIRQITFDINNCDLKTHIDDIKDGEIVIEITSQNLATLKTKSVLKIGDVLQFTGINKYPSPRSVTVLNKTNSKVTVQWVNTPTCFEISGFYIIVRHPDNTTTMIKEGNDTDTVNIENLSPGAEYLMTLFTEYRYQNEIIRSPDPFLINFITESFCSHLKPCYPGMCQAHVDKCTCSNGFEGQTCLDFDISFLPSLLTHTAISNRDSSTGQVLYSYASDIKNKENIIWSNQKDFNLIEFNIQASFIGTNIYGIMPLLPNYVSNASFGIVEGWIDFTHTSLLKGVTHKVLSCPSATQDTPVSDLSCMLFINESMEFESGDILTVNFSVRSGGQRTLVNFADGSEFAVDYYNGHVSHNIFEFQFDFDVPEHCSQSSCNDHPLLIENDVTKRSIRPRWAGWTDDLSGVIRYAFEVWKMQYNESSNGLQEPLITPLDNPKPQFSAETGNSDNNFPEYMPTEPGIYSCILEISDKANNSEYTRRIVVFDNLSYVSLNVSAQIIVSSALEETNFLWQSDFYPDTISYINISWRGLFSNEFHVNQHFLDKILTYEPRLSDTGRRKNYKRILQQYDDTEGDRTINYISHINGITRFEIVHKMVTRMTLNVPTSGWSVVYPLAETTSIEKDAYSLGDGSSVQLWVRGFDVLNNSKTASTIVHFDRTGPNVFLQSVDFDAQGDFDFTTRFSFINEDLHSGGSKFFYNLILKQTGEVRYHGNESTTQKVQSQCRQGCYCVPMGLCFMRTLSVEFDTCLLGVPAEIIEDGVYQLQVESYNNAEVPTNTTFELFVREMTGINEYPSPSSISFQNKTKNAIKMQWTLTKTCYVSSIVRHIIFLDTPNNATREFDIPSNVTDFTISDLSPGVEYSIEMFSEYGNETHVYRSPEPLVVKFVTSDPDPSIEESSSSKIPIIIGSVIGAILLIILTILAIIWILKRRHRNLCVGPISEPDVINGTNKKPMLKETPTMPRKLSNSVLSIPDSPSLEQANRKLRTNIFDISLPKGRAKTLPPLPPLKQSIDLK